MPFPSDTRVRVALLLLIPLVAFLSTLTPDPEASSLNLASLGTYKITGGYACLAGQAGKLVRKKNAEKFVKLAEYFKSKNKGTALTSDQNKTLKKSQALCKSLQVSETLYVDGELPRSCERANYSPTKRRCAKGKAKAFKSVAEALAASGPSDTIMIRETKKPYTQVVSIQIAGLPEARITLKNYPGESPHFQTNAKSVNTVQIGGGTSPSGSVPAGAYVTVQGLTLSNPSAVGAAVTVLGSRGVEVRNCHVLSSAGSGVRVDAESQNVTLDGNVVHGVSGPAIVLESANGHTLQYNFVFQSGTGIEVSEQHLAPNTVHHNVIVRNVGAGIYVGALSAATGTPSEYFNNVVYGNGSGIKVEAPEVAAL